MPILSGLGALMLQDQKPPDLKNYRKWQKVNVAPVRMADRIAAMCSAPQPAIIDSPHGPRFINVYVNRSGQRAMMDHNAKSYPEGAIIVKEKLSKIDSKKPELMTVMVKRPKGYAPSEGDWQFLVTDADGKVTASGDDTKHCGTCHRAQIDQGFVFRTYLGMATLKRSR